MEKFKSSSLRFHAVDVNRRNFTVEEIKALEAQGNTFEYENLQNIFLVESDRCYVHNIRSCSFFPGSKGRIVIERLDGIVFLDGIAFYSGLKNSSFYGDCYISSGCYIENVTILSNVFIGDKAILIDCGMVRGYVNGEGDATSTCYYNNKIISVGPENGGRNIMVHIGMSYEELCFKAMIKDKRDGNGITQNETMTKFESHLTVVLSNSRLFRCDRIISTLIDEDCTIISSQVVGSIIMTRSRILDNANVLDSLVQAYCNIERGCYVESTFLCESSCVGEQARVCQTILGPDSSVSGSASPHRYHIFISVP
jgi:NDP-sugar pyrophosphorylase family protein